MLFISTHEWEHGGLHCLGLRRLWLMNPLAHVRLRKYIFLIGDKMFWTWWIFSPYLGWPWIGRWGSWNLSADHRLISFIHSSLSKLFWSPFISSKPPTIVSVPVKSQASQRGQGEENFVSGKIKLPISSASKFADSISLCLKLSSICAKTEVLQNEEIKQKTPV